MPALRIDIRDTMISLVAALPGFNAQDVSASKLDKIEKTPTASVYLKELGNEPGANRGLMSRTNDVNVSLFIGDATDAEKALSELLNTLEKAVEVSRRSNGFPGVTKVYLSGAEIVHDATSKGKIADLHATFTFEFSEQIV